MARDQLDQSREDADRELPRQAALVSAWTQPGDNDQNTGFVANRSLDPIQQVAVSVVAADNEVFDKPARKNKGIMPLLYLGALPPCSQVTIPSTAMQHAAPQDGSGRLITENVELGGIYFIDVYGQRWGRLSSGPLEPVKTASDGKAGLGDKHAGVDMSLPGSHFSDLAAPKSLKDCGAEK
ncbi:hypothetical protein [Streptomyces chartreusis]|uniref:hypothetical protein n=1 Tax=Streptomyces chartreusis TaxID=1969 RepID=UPI0036BC6EB4